MCAVLLESARENECEKRDRESAERRRPFLVNPVAGGRAAPRRRAPPSRAFACARCTRGKVVQRGRRQVSSAACPDCSGEYCITMISDTCGYVFFLLLLLLVPYIESGESLKTLPLPYSTLRSLSRGTRPARASCACACACASRVNHHPFTRSPPVACLHALLRAR